MAGIPHHMTGWGGGGEWAGWPVSCHIHTQGTVRLAFTGRTPPALWRPFFLIKIFYVLQLLTYFIIYFYCVYSVYCEVYILYIWPCVYCVYSVYWRFIDSTFCPVYIVYIRFIARFIYFTFCPVSVITMGEGWLEKGEAGERGTESIL
jgi:hypothetical protein